MMVCPKCRSHRVGGPAYVKKPEALRYRCLTCGYSQDEPTADALPDTRRENLERLKRAVCVRRDTDRLFGR